MANVQHYSKGEHFHITECCGVSTYIELSPSDCDTVLQVNEQEWVPTYCPHCGAHLMKGTTPRKETATQATKTQADEAKSLAILFMLGAIWASMVAQPMVLQGVLSRAGLSGGAAIFWVSAPAVSGIVMGLVVWFTFWFPHARRRSRHSARQGAPL